jgi:molecular chaperone DnaK
MPLVVETVKKFFGKEPRRDVNPDEIVAMGAAVQGAILKGDVDNVLLYDVTPLTLGIRGKDDVMFKLITRNTSIPCKVEETFYTSEDNQEDVQIMVFQGEREEASKNKLLGTFVFEDLPPGRAREVAVKVCLSIDADGVIEVTATNPKTGRSQNVKIESNGGLTDAEIERMLADAEANKESDRILRETRVADAEADAELKGATKDLDKDYFKEAPADLQAQLRATIEELTALRQSPDKSLEALVETTKKLKDTRIAIGDAFNKASETSSDASDNDGDAPEAAEEQDNSADEGSAPKASKTGGPSL